MTEVALVALGLAIGFAAAVWVMATWTLWPKYKWQAFLTFQLAIAEVIAFLVLSARLLHFPLNLPMGVTTLLLIPIVVVPAALKFRDWLTAKDLEDRDPVRIHE